MSNRRWHKLNEKSFKQIKAMLDAEVPNSAINKLTGRGQQLIGNVKKARDFKGYKDIVWESTAKIRAIRDKQKAPFLKRIFHNSSPIENEIAKIRESLANIETLAK